MGQREYLEYLESPEWWSLRKRALARAHYRCERCGMWADGFEVHHRSYSRLGHERLDDLEVLCAPCHRNERLPRNRQKHVLEQYGQRRLFDRWDELPPAVERKKAA